MLLYLVPGPGIVKSLQKAGLHTVLTEQNVESALRTLRIRVKETLSPSYARRISQQIAAIPWDIPAFLTPGTHWVYIAENSEGEPARQLFLRTPLASEEKTATTLLPIASPAADAFLSLLIAQLEQAGKEVVLGRVGSR